MTDSDEALYARAKRGDMSAFDELYERYEGPLFAFLLRQVRQQADAEDVLHETWVRAFNAPEATFDDGGGFRAWIYRIARNLVLNRARTNLRGERAIHAIDTREPDAKADDLLADQEMRVALDDAVAKLPAPLAEIFHLRVSGLRYEEMADVLEIPLGTIKSRMNQMVSRLREELRSWTAS